MIAAASVFLFVIRKMHVAVEDKLYENVNIQ